MHLMNADGKYQLCFLAVYPPKIREINTETEKEKGPITCNGTDAIVSDSSETKKTGGTKDFRFYACLY